MAASYNFRPALNGFNREDVVHYIEFINTKNTALVSQLRADLAAAQQEVTALKAEPAKAAELEKQIAQLAEQLTQLQEELVALRAAKADADAALVDMTRQRDEAVSARPSVQCDNAAELEAYRRAERMERQARERADAIQERANGIISDATLKVDDAARKLNAVAGQVSAQLTAMQEAVGDSKKILQDAAMSLYELQS